MKKFIDTENGYISIKAYKLIPDVEVAKSLGVDVKDVQKAVVDNPKRFPPPYCMRSCDMDKNEMVIDARLDKTDGALNEEGYFFTDKGKTMLATVLESEAALKQSFAMVEAFEVAAEYVSTITKFSKEESEKSIDKEEQDRRFELTSMLFFDLYNTIFPENKQKDICEDSFAFCKKGEA